MCLARNYTTHWHTRPEKNTIIWFWPSVGKTCLCTSVQHGATETVSTYFNAFVCSAIVGRVCQCKILAKYGCSVTTALLIHFWFYLICRTVHIHTVWGLRWSVVHFGFCLQCFQPPVLPIGRFSSWSFCLSDVVQPVAIQVWRPPFADVAPSALATNVWADIFWFLFVPCTMFTLR